MSFFAKKKLSYYKNFQLDIWGIIKNNLQYKIDKTNYYHENLFGDAKYNQMIGKSYKKNYKFKNFIQNNKNNKNKSLYINTINQNRLKSILYFNLLFSVFKIKITNRLYKIYKVFFLNNKYNRQKYYFKQPFIYEPRIPFVKKKKYKMNSQFISLRVTRLFYIIYSYKQLKNIIKKIKKKDNVFEIAYISLMELKLPSFIYRSSLFSNMFESLNFIKGGNLWINKIIKSEIHYIVKVMDFVGFKIFYKSFVYWSFFKRIRRKAFIFLLPKYMFISLIFFIIILIRIPLDKEIINPITIDMYRISNYIS